MDTLRLYVRDAFRRLRLSPAFTAITLLTLALGLGATTAIFSVVYAVLLRPLPLPEPERLVGIWHSAPGLDLPQFEHSQATYLQYRSQSHTLADMGIYATESFNLTGGGAPERVPAGEATASFFSTLQIVPALGRTFAEADGLPGGAPVVLLSHQLWQHRFGGDRTVLGRSLELDGVRREVVGVLPASFSFPVPDLELWVPLVFDPAKPEISNFNYRGVARLRPGVTPAQVAGDLAPILARVPEVYPGDFTREMLEKAQMRVYAIPLKEEIVGETATLLWVLSGTVGVILLIACANVANLLLVRAESRKRELAVRGALGASPRHLLASWLAETLLLTATGGLLGVGLAWLGVAGLAEFGPADLPRRSEIAVDGVALLFAGGLSLLTGFVFGLLPFFSQRRATAALVLREGARGATAGRERFHARNVLVAVQVALALVLLSASGLLVRSFDRLRKVDPGMRSAGVLTVRVSLPDAKYPDLAAVDRFYAQALDAIRALPGVQAAGAVSGLPLTANRSRSGIAIEEFPRQPNDLPPVITNVHATSGYFEAMGIPLVAGRTYQPADNQEPSGALVVSESFAKRFWPHGSALGKRMQMGDAQPDRWLTIVGVVGDVRHDGLTRAAPEMIYLPVVGKNGPAGWAPSSMTFTLRTGGAPESLARPLRETLARLDPDLPLAALQTMAEVERASTARTTFAMALLLLAAGVAVTLGAVGLYGVISYLVARRRREIGVRMALGAERGRVAQMVVLQGLAVSGVGLGIGLATAMAASHLLRGLLFEISPTDPPTYAAVAVVLLAVCLAASYIPARKAAAVAPVEALQGE